METQNFQAIEPPGLALYRIGIGHYFSRALALAAKLGIADFLTDGPRRYEDLAKATDTHAPSLNRVLRLLASIGIFEEREDGIFALTPTGDLLRTGAPGSMRSSVQLFAGVGIQDSWKELEYCVQTGEPASFARWRCVLPDCTESRDGEGLRRSDGDLRADDRRRDCRRV